MDVHFGLRYKALNSAIAVAPITAYVWQYLLIKGEKNTGSFSVDICGVLIIANIMRVAFWFTTGYAINLLIQSLLLLIVQFLLLDLCVSYGFEGQ